MILGRVETSASEGEPDSHQERPYVADVPEADVGTGAEIVRLGRASRHSSTVLMATSRGGGCIQSDQKMAEFGAPGRDRTTDTRIFSEASFTDRLPQVPTLCILSA